MANHLSDFQLLKQRQEDNYPKNTNPNSTINRIKRQLIALENKRFKLQERLNVATLGKDKQTQSFPFVGTCDEYLALCIEQASRTLICLEAMDQHERSGKALLNLEAELIRINQALDTLPTIVNPNRKIINAVPDRMIDYTTESEPAYYFSPERTAGCVFIKDFDAKKYQSQVDLTQHNFVYVMTGDEKSRKIYLIEARRDGVCRELSLKEAQNILTIDKFDEEYASVSAALMAKMDDTLSTTHNTQKKGVNSLESGKQVYVYSDAQSYCDMAVLKDSKVARLSQLDKVQPKQYSLTELHAGYPSTSGATESNPAFTKEKIPFMYIQDDEVNTIRHIITHSPQNNFLSNSVNLVVIDAKEYAKTVEKDLGLKHKIIKYFDKISEKLGFGPSVKLGKEVELTALTNTAGFFNVAKLNKATREAAAKEKKNTSNIAAKPQSFSQNSSE